jgi:hypothetical protein
LEYNNRFPSLSRSLIVNPLLSATYEFYGPYCSPKRLTPAVTPFKMFELKELILPFIFQGRPDPPETPF